MKQKLFSLLACAASAFQAHAMDTCFTESCSDVFGFDSVLTFEVGGGYREDVIEWTTNPASTPGASVKEKWHGLNTGIVDAAAEFLACEHYLLRADFDYGWFSDKGYQDITTTITTLDPDTSSESEVHARTKGRVCDLSGEVGYQFNSACNTYSFAPMVGYGYHFQKLVNKHYNNELDDVDSATSSAPDTIVSHNTYISRWSGPKVGFQSLYEISCDWQVGLNYYYTFATYHSKVKEHFAADTPGVPVGPLTGHQHAKNGSGNEITAYTVFEFSEDWLFGINFDYRYFSATKGKFKNDLYESNVRHIRWTSWDITANVGYVF